MKRAIDNSLAFGLYRGDSQIGFAQRRHRPCDLRLSRRRVHRRGERARGRPRLVDAILAHARSARAAAAGCSGPAMRSASIGAGGFAEPPGPFSFLERLDGGV